MSEKSIRYWREQSETENDQKQREYNYYFSQRKFFEKQIDTTISELAAAKTSREVAELFAHADYDLQNLHIYCQRTNRLFVYDECVVKVLNAFSDFSFVTNSSITTNNPYMVNIV